MKLMFSDIGVYMFMIIIHVELLMWLFIEMLFIIYI